MNKKIAFQTFGCKLNFAETSQISRQFIENGYEIADFKETADVYVINTCTVTSIAEKKCKTAIRSAINRNPDAKVAVIGCFSQLKAEEIQEIEGVDLIVGNNEKHKLFEIISNRNNNNATNCAYCDVKQMEKSDAFVPSYSSGDRTRSFLKIQDGCDYFCTYCAIPFARGRSRSDTIANIVKSAEAIANEGLKEVILTGVNIGDFGKQNNESFLQLIQALDKVNGIERYRISSIEPDLLTDEIIEFVANSNKFLPHFHIPLQSGSNKILKMMKRHYQRELFAERVYKIKSVMPDACIAADVICGFPGETDEDFKDTYNFIDALPISYLHVFTYSERPDTIAAKLEDKVPVNIRRERSKALQILSDKKKHNFYLENTTSVRKVLFESDIHNGYIFGFTDNYIRVKTKKDLSLVNNVFKVKLKILDNDEVFFAEKE
ncbi:MAG: tRNA (N(6)-L-threonylcarbamoyladenosine(37)-C(2))-methylthiotransferase MtaB [Bacteroidetes bacterium]|nr:tRNA (N(6)-L-threonylcarbamoyladenosine(37)-C(2))-methylthiotransferase MtaB [Bacteroidota bacterium]